MPRLRQPWARLPRNGRPAILSLARADLLQLVLKDGLGAALTSSSFPICAIIAFKSLALKPSQRVIQGYYSYFRTGAAPFLQHLRKIALFLPKTASRPKAFVITCLH